MRRRPTTPQPTAMAMMTPCARPPLETGAAAAELVAEGVALVELEVVAELDVGLAVLAAPMTEAAPAACEMKLFSGIVELCAAADVA